MATNEEEGIKQRVWFKLCVLAGWFSFWRNGYHD